MSAPTSWRKHSRSARRVRLPRFAITGLLVFTMAVQGMTAGFVPAASAAEQAKQEQANTVVAKESSDSAADDAATGSDSAKAPTSGEKDAASKGQSSNDATASDGSAASKQDDDSANTPPLTGRETRR